MSKGICFVSPGLNLTSHEEYTSKQAELDVALDGTRPKLLNFLNDTFTFKIK